MAEHGSGERSETDGLPEIRRPLTPNQRAIRTAILRYFEGSVMRFADDVGCSRQAVYTWIWGEQDPERDTIDLINGALPIPLDDLWAPEPEAIYVRGFKIGPDHPAYHEILEHVTVAVKRADPKTAEKLKL